MISKKSSRIVWSEKPYQWALIFLLVLLFLFAMNTYTKNLGGSGVQIPYNIFSWLVASLIVTLAVVRILIRGELRLHVTTYYYAGFFLILLFPLLYTDRLFLDVEFQRLLGMGAGFLFFIAIQQAFDDKLSYYLLIIVFASALVQTGLGVAQYYVVIEGIDYVFLAQKFRPFGIFQQVNVYSIFLAVGTLSAVYIWIVSRYSGSVFFRFCLFGLVCLNANLIALSKADAAKVVSLICVVFYLVYLSRIRTQSRLFLLFLAGAFTFSLLKSNELVEGVHSHFQKPIEHVSAALSPTSQVREVTFPSMDETERLKAAPGWSLSIDKLRQTLGTRPTIYFVALEMFLDAPLVGHGIGSFRKQYLLYQGRFLEANPDWPGEFVLSHPHNEPIYWAVELGALSGLAFLFLFIVWVFAVRRQYLDPAVFFIASPLLVHSLFELPLYHSAPHYLTLCVILSAAMNKQVFTTLSFPRWIAMFVFPSTLWALVKVWFFLVLCYQALLMFLLFEDSKPRDIRYLAKIGDPAAFKLRYEFEIFQWKLRSAENQGRIDLEDLSNFKAWAFSTLQYAPMQTTYRNFITALVLVRNDTAARQYLNEAMLMYPREPIFEEYNQELNKRALLNDL